MNLHTAYAVAFLTLFLAVPPSTEAGTLADAPFRLTLPSEDWHVESHEPVTFSSNLTRIAYATNATELRTVVLREQLTGVSDGNLEQLGANMLSKLTNANVKVAESKTTFIGLPTHLLVYNMKIGSDTLHTETILLVVGEAGWTIAAIGPLGREEDIKHILRFYSKK